MVSTHFLCNDCGRSNWTLLSFPYYRLPLDWVAKNQFHPYMFPLRPFRLPPLLSYLFARRKRDPHVMCPSRRASRKAHPSPSPLDTKKKKRAHLPFFVQLDKFLGPCFPTDPHCVPVILLCIAHLLPTEHPLPTLGLHGLVPLPRWDRESAAAPRRSMPRRLRPPRNLDCCSAFGAAGNLQISCSTFTSLERL